MKEDKSQLPERICMCDDDDCEEMVPLDPQDAEYYGGLIDDPKRDVAVPFEVLIKGHPKPENASIIYERKNYYILYVEE